MIFRVDSNRLCVTWLVSPCGMLADNIEITSSLAIVDVFKREILTILHLETSV